MDGNSLTSDFECAIETSAPDLCLNSAVASAPMPGRTTNPRGRPRITTERPWDVQGISRSTYYARIKPALPAQISYPVEPVRWFCIRLPYLTDDGAQRVNEYIQGMGFETFFPREWVPPVAAHRTDAGRAIPARTEHRVPLLRSYALVRFDRTDQSWRDLARFGQILGSPEWPTPIPDGDIAKLRAGLDDDGVLYPDAPETVTTGAKKRWVGMLDALAARAAEMEAV